MNPMNVTPQLKLNEVDMGQRSGFCVLCNASTITVCQRCADFYCSVTCQKKDWYRHRYICFPMPALINASMLPADAGLVSDCLNGKVYSANKVEEVPQVLKHSRLKTLSNANDNANIEPSNALFPPEGSEIVLKFFRSLNRCVVHSLYSDHFTGMQSVMEKVGNFIRLSCVPKNNIQKDAYAISTLNGVYHRIQIGNRLQGQKYWVHFIDVGITVCRSKNEIFEISPELIALPCYIKIVQLHGVDSIDFSKKVQNHLENYRDGRFTIEYVKTNTKTTIPIVILHYANSPKTLNDEIKLFIKSLNVPPEINNQPINGEKSANKDDPFPSKPFNTLDNQLPKARETNMQHIDLSTSLKPPSKDEDTSRASVSRDRSRSLSKENVDDSRSLTTLTPPFQMQHFKLRDANFTAFVLDNSCINLGYVGCIMDTHMKQLLSVQTFLRTDYVDTGVPYMPKLNEYCLAMYEDEWHRAKVNHCDPENDEFTVNYIDFTNEGTLSSESIRPYCKELTNDCYTTLCLIDGLPDDLESKQIEFLRKELAFRKLIHIDEVIDVVDTVAVITCKDLLSKLHKEELL